MAKRAFDLFFSVVGLLVLSPVLLLVAIAVKLSSRGPVLFRQQRVGLGGERFWMLKFRSMVENAEDLGLGVTRDGDPRITAVGRFLRKTKLDELPQLWNVLVGEMSFVGPRPEVPRYVAQYTPEQRRVLELKPGITDLATLEFRKEEEILRQKAETLKAEKLKAERRNEGGNTKGTAEYAKDAEEETGDAVERFYLEYCVPRKIELSLEYARRANVWEDVKLILRTLWALGTRRSAQDTTQRATLQGAPGTAPGGR